jgi:type I restriction enzyme M protein
MARRARNASRGRSDGAIVGYEAELWRMADALRGSMDAAEYKHVSVDRTHQSCRSSWHKRRS